MKFDWGIFQSIENALFFDHGRDFIDDGKILIYVTFHRFKMNFFFLSDDETKILKINLLKGENGWIFQVEKFNKKKLKLCE